MNKLYLIVPVVLTLAFSGIYYTHSLDAGQKAEAAAAAAAQAEAEAAAKKAETERQAREDAERRAAERLAEEQRREDERRAKQAAADKVVADDTAAYLAKAKANTAELKTLETRLATLRSDKEKAIQAAFDFDLEIEKARIAKRSAELEIQRLVEMTARRAGTTLAPAVATP